jgi:hypothetical protein
MSSDECYKQVAEIPIEMRCLAPWSQNKHSDEIWKVYSFMLQHSGAYTFYELTTIFNVNKKFNRFRNKILKPLVTCGFINQSVTIGSMFNQDLWTYKITAIGKQYFIMLNNLIHPRKWKDE